MQCGLKLLLGKVSQFLGKISSLPLRTLTRDGEEPGSSPQSNKADKEFKAVSSTPQNATGSTCENSWKDFFILTQSKTGFEISVRLMEHMNLGTKVGLLPRVLQQDPRLR